MAQKPSGYYTHLDSLRGIAALIVCLFHVNWTNDFTKNAFVGYGGIFVDFFFVLSGIIMCHVYPAIKTRPDATTFLQRRFARLYPLHLATLLALAAAFGFVRVFVPGIWAKLSHLPQLHGMVWKFFANLLLLNAHGLTDSESFNVPSWSIGAEVSCYLVFALIGLIAFHRRYYLYAGVSLVSLLGLLAFQRNIDTFQNDFGVIRGFFGFFLGCLAYAYWSRWSTHRWARGLFVPLAIMSLTCVAISFGRAIPDWASFGFPPLFALLLYVLIDPDPRIVRVLSTPPLRLLGKLSYSIYLLHFLVRWGIGVVILAGLHARYTSARFNIPAGIGDILVVLYTVAVIAAAWLSFEYFEDPMRKWLRRGTRKPVTPAAGAADA